MTDSREIPVRIVDPEHPHYPETGRFTGDVIKPIWGGKMALVKLDACRHGTDACYVSPGQVKEISERSLRMKHQKRGLHEA